MSDPVTNMEIEDVLSSIRRLVSEDTRPKRVTESRAQSDRLVLTPALRVKQDRPVAPEAPVVSKGARNANAPVLLTNPTVLPSDNSKAVPPRQVDAPVTLHPSELASSTVAAEADETPGQDQTNATSGDSDAVGLLRDDDGPDRADEAEPEFADDDYGFAADAPLTASSILSQLVEQEVARAFSEGATPEEDQSKTGETKVESAPGQAVDDGWSIDADGSGDLGALVSEDIAEQPDVVEMHEAIVETQTGAPVSEASGSTLESKIAELEAMVGRQSGDWDYDSAEEPTFVHRPTRAIDWEDHPRDTRPEAGRKNDSAEVETQVQVAEDAAAEGLPTIDEATLHQMVSEIVREELRGALGERITRNVRKLVRREIHRAMISQDFD